MRRNVAWGGVFLGVFLLLFSGPISLSAVLFQMLGHVVGVLFYFVLGDGWAIAVPAVPSHGRTRRPFPEVLRCFIHGLMPRAAGEADDGGEQ